MHITTARTYDPVQGARNKQYRVLVDRIWPRGIAKDKAQIDGWGKELAPQARICANGSAMIRKNGPNFAGIIMPSCIIKGMF